jgi:hypothetical protein
MFGPAPRGLRRRLGTIASSWLPAGRHGDPVIREAKLVGFAILLAAIFLGAHLAGSALGPVTTSRSQVIYPGQGGGTGGGMTMGGGSGQGTAPAVRLRGGRP